MYSHNVYTADDDRMVVYWCCVLPSSMRLPSSYAKDTNGVIRTQNTQKNHWGKYWNAGSAYDVIFIYHKIILFLLRQSTPIYLYTVLKWRTLTVLAKLLKVIIYFTFDNDNGTTERAILTKGGFTKLNSSTTSLQVVKTRSEFQMETNRVVLDIDSASCVKRIN